MRREVEQAMHVHVARGVLGVAAGLENSDGR